MDTDTALAIIREAFPEYEEDGQMAIQDAFEADLDTEHTHPDPLIREAVRVIRALD